jgi:molecular chaperone DnaK
VSVVGIDLGTSNSVVAYEDGEGHVHILPDKKGLTIQPSVVSFSEGGGVVIGAEAKALKSADPRNTIYSFKRLMGQTTGSVALRQFRSRVPFIIHDGVEENDMPTIRTRAGELTPVELSSIMLDHMRGIAAAQLQQTIERAVITVPANFSDSQRSATASAAAIAGLQIAGILNEPTAVALAYGATRHLDETVAVFDFGGGTFDLTVMRLENQTYTVLGTAGDSFLGGDDIDERIVELMLRNVIRDHRVDLHDDIFAMMKLRAVAEEVKIALSSQPSVSVTVFELAIGSNGLPITLEFTLTHAELVSLISDLVDRAMSVTRDALAIANVRMDQISDIILAGGTTRIPYIRHRIANFFERSARSDVSPQEAVAIGAALYATSVAQARVHGVGIDEPQPAYEPKIATLDAMPSTVAASQHVVDIDEAVAEVDSPVFDIDAAIADVDSVSIDFPSTVAPRTMTPPIAVVSGRRVVIDVTPNSLGVGTAGGFCEVLIPRSSPLPATVKKFYATLRDLQEMVRIVVCQGEARRLAENLVLGDVILNELPRLPRGDVEIEVAFELDTSGMLQVSALDGKSGRSQRVSLDLVGRMNDSEVAAARERMQRLGLGGGG